MSRNWQTGPRTTILAEFFDKLATGKEGAPHIDRVVADFSLFGGRKELETFYENYINFSSTFNTHFLASIPFVLEEECRLGAAIFSYLDSIGKRESRTTYLQTIESAEAVLARTIVSNSQGGIRSLSNSPTEANRQAFLKNQPEGSFFFLGSFFDLTQEIIQSCLAKQENEVLFDFIYEDTGFQMYAVDRQDQIEMVIQNLSEDGIFCCLEKCLHPDEEEYLSRNRQQNSEFKTRYFYEHQINDKEHLLGIMKENQVLLQELVRAIRAHFGYVQLTWNSGNFYTLAASNNRANLQEFVEALGAPCIPSSYQYERLGSILY